MKAKITTYFQDEFKNLVKMTEPEIFAVKTSKRSFGNAVYLSIFISSNQKTLATKMTLFNNIQMYKSNRLT